jgi:hypothetical protein
MSTETERIEKLEDKAPTYITYSVFFTVTGLLMGIVASIFTYQMSRISAVEAKLDSVNELNIKMAEVQKDIQYIRKSLDEHIN